MNSILIVFIVWFYRKHSVSNPGTCGLEHLQERDLEQWFPCVIPGSMLEMCSLDPLQISSFSTLGSETQHCMLHMTPDELGFMLLCVTWTLRVQSHTAYDSRGTRFSLPRVSWALRVQSDGLGRAEWQETPAVLWPFHTALYDLRPQEIPFYWSFPVWASFLLLHASIPHFSIHIQT